MSNSLPHFLTPLAKGSEATDWTPPTGRHLDGKTWAVVSIAGRLYPMSAHEYWEHVEGRGDAEVIRVIHTGENGPFEGDPADLI